ncbi:MAG: glycosyltransferase family 2 protein, partial [Patescibacteria group bacterium]
YKKNNNLNNLKIIKNKNNFGFAKANNQAIKQAIGDYILLLNPDTELIDDSILKLINFLENNKKAGLVGPKLLNADKTLQRSCRQFPKLLDQIFIQLKFYNFFPNKIKAVQKYFMLDFNHENIKEVDQIMGAAMLIKKEVFNKIGLLDEKFWAVFEEVDFCKRTKDAGYKIYFNPVCQIIHQKEQSFKQIASLNRQINFNHSLYYYFKKHKPFWQLFVLWFFQPINIFLTWIDKKVNIRKRLDKSKDL